jgi:ankyrin repeat protein
MSKTALIVAVKNLDLAATKKILDEKPALLSVTDRQGRNLLHLACSVPSVPSVVQIRFVEYLLDRGFEIDLPIGKDNVTPLFFAVARARSPKLVKFLIQRGAKVENAPGGGLFAAAWYDDVKNLKLLLDQGAEIDVVVGITPFLAAWLWRKFDAAKYLAKRGANVNFRDKKGRDALYFARERKYSPELLAWIAKKQKMQVGLQPDRTG